MAQSTGQTVTITGRVFNVDSGLYIKSAEVRIDGTNTIVYTEDGGLYSIVVPVGKVSLTASYANTRPSTLTIDARVGVPNILDFELQPISLGTGLGTAGTTKPISEADLVVLEKFTVTSERAGQAQAFMEQKAADNAKTVIAVDQFGELTQGSVGEFMKYMPGVTLDLDDEGETAYVRVGGLDPKYAGFSMDGISLASATEGSTRANHFQQMSITAIESIEFNQTLLARMPANTPAGKFEMKTRYAFNRKKPEISFDLGLDGTGETIEWGSAYLPDNKKHRRTYIGGRLGFGGAFLKRRLGIEASVSRYQQYRNDQRHTVQYTYPTAPHINVADGSYSNPNPGTNFVVRNGHLEAAEGPTIRQIEWLDGPRIKTSQSANLSVDFKITPELTFAIRNQYTYNENEYFNTYFQLLGTNRDDDMDVNVNAPTPGLDPTSTLTRWVVNPTGPAGTQALESVLTESPSFRVTKNTNYVTSPRLTYKSGPLEIQLRTAYSSSKTELSDGDEGRFRAVRNRLGGVGWIAERPSTDSPEWNLTQTAGSLWTEPQNMGRAATYLWDTWYDEPHFVRNTQLSGYLDVTYAARVFGHPVTFRAGGGILENEYKRRYSRKRYDYIGPEGMQMATVFPYADNYVFNMDLGGKSGNVNQQNWAVVDQNALWDTFEEHPEWFIFNEVDHIRQRLVGRRDLTETIDAIYAEATTRAGKFQINFGLRAERTETEVLITRMLSKEEITAYETFASPEEIATGMFNTDTTEGVLFQYNYGAREKRKEDYDNIFLSGGLKYDLTKSLRFQLSFSQAILRPDYGNISGTVNYPDYYPTNLWIPNPKLKPEKTTKFYAGFQWYLKPSGIFEISAYRLDIKDLQINNMQITSEQAEAQLGYSLEDAMKGMMNDSGLIVDEETEVAEEVFKNIRDIGYRSTINADGTRVVYGITVRYDQQLTFLPGPLKGIGIFGSFTTAKLKNAEIDEEKIGRASKSANGGIKYRYGRFNVQLRGSWTDDALKSITRPYPGRKWNVQEYQYQKARFIVDLSGGWRLNKNLELVFSIRNLTQEPYIRYSNVPGRVSWYSVPDTIWNFSIRGKY
ncbi:TonB-dependent receptor [Ereboglobus sp. PH5-10]|uniref:TonB-dependent receptor n=1 Tax=Ereboglobus sp. PH5-10 TaxID=2940629 RepID=UPI0024069DF5|nr:TonB-dependent receptor [Ereboglobus sp. PH5-10]